MNKSDDSKGERNLVKGAIAGLAAGLAASFVMNKYQEMLSQFSDDKKPGRKSDPATVKAAEAITESTLDHELDTSEKPIAGSVMHYAMGGFSGLVYGIAAEAAPVSSVGKGLPFGTAVWAIADEMVVPALGLSGSSENSFKVHASALSSHLVYGLTTDLVRKTVRSML